MSPQTVGLVAHVGKPGAKKLAQTLVRDFKARGIRPSLERETAKMLGRADGLPIPDLAARCDLLVVLGGDGTILRVVRDSAPDFRPIFGINLGKLGFLTCVGWEDHMTAVEAIATGRFALSHRRLIEVGVARGRELLGSRLALNDAAVMRGSTLRLIRLLASVDGHPIGTYNADGLVVATPTGSTAYALSAGGPILTPDSGVLAVTPVCPHVLTNRTILVADTSVIEIRPETGQGGAVYLSVDGQELRRIAAGDRIVVRKSDRELPLAMLPDATFFDVLREKLNWSGTVV